MVQVSYPGVYIREVPSGSRTITGVSTSIAAFVGVTQRGPVGEPVAVLSYSDYVRAFSDDTIRSEMTDQVRQFFLNGGQQAYVLRIAHGASQARAQLTQTPGLSLIARNSGSDGNSLRAVVDYNTAEPERTFNLTIYREAIGPTGLGEVVEQEQLKGLSMDPASARYARIVIARDSKFCTIDETAPAPTSAAGVSVGGRLIVGAYGAGAVTAIEARLHAGFQGRFRITVGQETGVATITATAFTTDPLDLRNDIASSAVITPANFTVAYITSGGLSTVVFRAVNPLHDVRIEAIGDLSSDIASILGWGQAQGGLEFGSYAAARPLPNGLVSRLSPAAADITSLVALAAQLRSDFDGSVSLTGPASPFTATLPELTSPTLRFAEAPTGGPLTLTNVAAVLSQAATAINNSTTNRGWSAEIQGLRLALIPTYGTATAGTGHFFAAGGPAWFVGDTGLFDDALADGTPPRAYSLGSGLTGTNPETADYAAAFGILESQVDLVNLLILPRTHQTGTDVRSTVWAEASAFCDRNRAFLIIDPTGEPRTVDAALASVKTNRLGIVKDHAAMYWPRIYVKPDGQRRAIDPSGTLAGVMSRIDSTRGVWKAPAGTEADLRGVFGVEVSMSDPENGRLNPEALNCIRAFTSGIVSWGARTMDGFDNSGNDDYKYLPVRRFALFLEESLYRGLQWAVFEPNDHRLWSQIRMVVSSFMNGLYRQGAFFGETPKEAFFVKVDSETTTPNDINLGICNVIVGFAPVKPAEFIVVTIKQKAGQVQV